MSNQWYRYKNNEVVGPYAVDALLAMVKSGELHPADLVCKEGTTDWIRADAIKLPKVAQASSDTPASSYQSISATGSMSRDVSQELSTPTQENPVASNVSANTSKEVNSGLSVPGFVGVCALALVLGVGIVVYSVGGIDFSIQM